MFLASFNSTIGMGKSLALPHQPGTCLEQGFEHDDAGHYREPRKMVLQVLLVGDRRFTALIRTPGSSSNTWSSWLNRM